MHGDQLDGLSLHKAPSKASEGKSHLVRGNSPVYTLEVVSRNFCETFNVNVDIVLPEGCHYTEDGAESRWEAWLYIPKETQGKGTVCFWTSVLPDRVHSNRPCPSVSPLVCPSLNISETAH